MTDHKVALKELQDAIADASEAADHAGAKLAAMREILIRPEGPAALVAYHGNATRATEHLDFLDGELATVETNTKETRKQISGVEGGADDLRKMIKELYRGVRADSNGPLYANVDMKAPLVQKVAQAAAEAGHPVPAPKPTQIPWQKIRLWAEADGRLGAAELHGRDRLHALHDVLLDGCGNPGAWTCPPWLATKGDEEDEGGGDVEIDGRPVFIGDVLQIDDTLIFWGDSIEIAEAGLEHLLGSEGPGSEPDPGNPEPEYVGGKVRFRRRVKGTTLTAEDLAYLDGIVAYEIVEVSRFGDYTNYTIERTHLPPPAPPTPAETPAPEPGLGVLDPDPTDAESAPSETDPDLAVKCPTCNREPGEPCQNYKGKGCATHADRRKFAEKARGGGTKPKKQKKGA